MTYLQLCMANILYALSILQVWSSRCFFNILYWFYSEYGLPPVGSLENESRYGATNTDIDIVLVTNEIIVTAITGEIALGSSPAEVQ